MALSDANKHLCKSILGIPDTNSTLTLNGLFQKSKDPNYIGYTPNWVVGDISGVQTQVDAILAAVNAQQEARINAICTQWESLTPWNPLAVNKGENSSEGTLVNYPKERQNLHFELMTELGIALPDGGFVGEYKTYNTYSGDR